jgi:PAS domain-containing protein
MRILEPLPLPAYVWDIKTERFIGWNAALLDLLGYTADELHMLDWRNLVLEAEVEVAERAIQQGAAMSSVQWQWRTKHGVITVTLASRTTTFFDDDKNEREVRIGIVTAVGTAGQHLHQSLIPDKQAKHPTVWLPGGSLFARRVEEVDQRHNVWTIQS